MKKILRKFIGRVFPYVFNGLLIYLLLQGSTSYARVACWLMWMWGAFNIVIGLSLTGLYKNIAETQVKKRGTGAEVEGWFKPETNYLPTIMVIVVAALAVGQTYVVTGTVYALGAILVALGVFMIKEYIKENYAE